MPSSQTPISVAEAAEQKGIPARTVRYAILHGDLPAHKLPGRTGSYVINQDELDQWAAKRETQAEASA